MLAYTSVMNDGLWRGAYPSSISIVTTFGLKWTTWCHSIVSSLRLYRLFHDSILKGSSNSNSRTIWPPAQVSFWTGCLINTLSSTCSKLNSWLSSSPFLSVLPTSKCSASVNSSVQVRNCFSPPHPVPPSYSQQSAMNSNSKMSPELPCLSPRYCHDFS